MTTKNLDILAQESGRWAAEIASLALAATCMLSGSGPADDLVIENTVLNLLNVIEELAGRAEHSMEVIERGVREPTAA